MISQDRDGHIYVANNMGLLEYNGSDWTAYHSPNHSVMRSVHASGDRVYTGCYEELGYWERDSLGQLAYYSLMGQLDSMTLHDDQVWNILEYGEWIIFQTARYLIFYHQGSRSIKTIASDHIIYKVFLLRDQIYYHVAQEGLYVLRDGEPDLVSDDPLLLRERIIHITSAGEKLRLLTRNSGFYLWHDGKMIKDEILDEKRLEGLTIFSGMLLQDGSYALGTIADGLLLLDPTGKIDYQLHQRNGLADNTVLCLYHDHGNNLWLGLDHGIACVNTSATLSRYEDHDGDIGSVYAAAVEHGKLYVGTNQGLFSRDAADANDDFEPVKGLEGQVWTLYHDKDQLLCGHHLGTYAIGDTDIRKISDALGAWTFKQIPGRDELLLRGNYDGLYVMREINGSWQESHKVEGWDISSRHVEIDQASQIWVNHEYRGLYRLRLDSLMLQAQSIKRYDEIETGLHSAIVKYKGEIHHYSQEGLLSYDPARDQYVADSTMSNLFPSDDYSSGKLIVDDSDRLWTFSQSGVAYIDNDDITNQMSITRLPLAQHILSGIAGYENITSIGDDGFLLGTTYGYLILENTESQEDSPPSISLHQVVLRPENGQPMHLDKRVPGEWHHNMDLVSFSYSVPHYKEYEELQYQHRLVNYRDHWSDWTSDSQAEFKKLPHGDYTFQVRARTGGQLTDNVASYDFRILKPWYISTLAICLYVLLAILLGLIIHRAYRYYFERLLKHEQLKSEKAIMQLQNDSLQQEIQGKKNELAIATMSMVRKGELLSKIRKELQSGKVESTLKLIDKNMNDDEDWAVFQDAVNNAGQGFLDKIKDKHANLSPNDLRFCTYLRANLTSKEIAPLLNISTKSVETKRYRLRKKLDLAHDVNLVDYILSF